uniref:Lysophospholipid acyltransferase 1 n=1 Tax=Cacopsylla melanoneura TaxID=428564 RepID=A0A8D8PMQ1_9HEMI
MTQSSSYGGSTLFYPIAELVGLPIDQANFIISQLIALALASLLRSTLSHKTTSSSVRQLFSLSLGVFVGVFCFGYQVVHLAALPVLCYLIMRTLSPSIMQNVVLVVALGYLSIIHLRRQVFDYGSYVLDVTGPLMVMTQKVTSLAFSLHDGLTKSPDKLTSSQKSLAIREIPSMLDYFCYILQFQTIMCGPVVFFNDYKEYIEGTNFEKKRDREVSGTFEPSPGCVVAKKVVGAAACAVIFVQFGSAFNITYLKDESFFTHSLAWKIFYIYVTTLITRLKYYHAWLVADAICNNSGLGFNGLTETGEQKWDLISNVDIISFEMATNFRNSIDAWNKGTNRWLRVMVYERVQSHSTGLTYGLSALWHGFYPGYYVTFASGALFTFGARAGETTW